MKNRNFTTLLTLSFITLLGSIHQRFIGTGIRLNPFLFYDYVTKSGKEGKLVMNILYEVSYKIIIITLLVMLVNFASTKSLKLIIHPFTWIACIDLVEYFLFYKMGSSTDKLILLVMIILIYNRRWIKKELWKSK